MNQGPFALLLFKGESGIGHGDGIVGRVHAEHGVTSYVHDFVEMTGVVVTEKDEVEARHLTRHFLGGVLLIGRRRDTARLSRMEESDDNIGFLLLFHDFHPALGCRHHLVETQPAPDVLRQPVGNGGGEHAEDSNAASVALDDGVRLQIRRARGCVDDVGTEHGTFDGSDPFVVDPVPGFHIVVADRLRVIAEIVDDLCGDVRLCGVDEIGVVAHGLSLEDVAVVEEQHVLAILFTQFVHIAAHARHASGFRFAVEQVVGEE